MNSVLKSADGKDLILTCTCGCRDAIHFNIDTSDPDFYFCMSYMSSNWYRDQCDSMWQVFCKKLKKIWRIIRNKDHHYSEICMRPDEFDVFREYVNSVCMDKGELTMNHDATHCADWNENCPKSCYRAQLTEELRRIEYPWPVSMAFLKNTNLCPLSEKKEEE